LLAFFFVVRGQAEQTITNDGGNEEINQKNTFVGGVGDASLERKVMKGIKIK
jgi:hypothetical protein